MLFLVAGGTCATRVSCDPTTPTVSRHFFVFFLPSEAQDGERRAGPSEEWRGSGPYQAQEIGAKKTRPFLQRGLPRARLGRRE